MTSSLILLRSLIPLVLAQRAPPPAPDHGAEPRAALRYALVVGAEQGFTARSTLRTEQEAVGKTTAAAQPALTLMGRARVLKASDTGFSVALVIQRIDPEAPAAPAATDPGAIRTARELWAQVVPLRVEVDVDARGRLGRAQLQLPRGRSMPPELREPIQGVYDLVRALYAPLPEEPVGVGATWSRQSQREEGPAQE